jgi:hypothetical protein
MSERKPQAKRDRPLSILAALVKQKQSKACSAFQDDHSDSHSDSEDHSDYSEHTTYCEYLESHYHE